MERLSWTHRAGRPAKRGARALRAKHTERGTVLVDGVGRTQGVLVEDTP